MAKAESTGRNSMDCLNIDFMRSLVKQYSELGQWTSALFWADAAAGAGSSAGAASGDDVWLLAGAMLAQGELHRAAHTVTSRGLHKNHLLCLGVAMRAFVLAKEASAALDLYDECDPALLEPRNMDHTHNRALAGVLVWRARALAALERRAAQAEALAAALAADAACAEALQLLLQQHALTHAQEMELIDSLPISQQLAPAEAALVRAAYRERALRYSPCDPAPPAPPPPPDSAVETARARTAEAAASRAQRLAAACRWDAALRLLDTVDPWCCPEVRVACLTELRRASDLFAFAHTLVDAYPQTWQAWFAVGCYYYVIGKSELACRYLSKAKSVEGGAGGGGGGGGGGGCVWLAYGHSFALDQEHDQAMAAYFKASQLMAGCHLPALYVAVECSQQHNNVAMCERFFARAAAMHAGAEPAADTSEDDENKCGWDHIARIVRCAHTAHEAGCAALLARQPRAAGRLLLAAHSLASQRHHELSSRWAPTLDALGHAYRKLGQPAEALEWHQKALALRPGRASTYCAMGLCLALLGRDTEAADALHSALSKDPDDVVALALLDAIVDRLDSALTEEEIPQFPFPTVTLALPPTPATPATPNADATVHSDMSMSFD